MQTASRAVWPQLGAGSVAGAWAVVLGALAGCAGAHDGWALDDARSCGDRPRVCVRSEPDRGGEYFVGGTVLIPGECARPDESGATWVAVEARRDGAPTRRRLLRSSPRRVHVVTRHGADDRGRDHLGVERWACPAGEVVSVPAEPE